MSLPVSFGKPIEIRSNYRIFSLRVVPLKLQGNTYLATEKARDVLLNYNDVEAVNECRVPGLSSVYSLENRACVFFDPAEAENQYGTKELVLTNGKCVTGKAAASISDLTSNYFDEIKATLTPAHKRLIGAILLYFSALEPCKEGFVVDGRVVFGAKLLLESERDPSINASDLCKYADLRIVQPNIFYFIRKELFASLPREKLRPYYEAAKELRKLLDPLQKNMEEIYQARREQCDGDRPNDGAKILPFAGRS